MSVEPVEAPSATKKTSQKKRKLSEETEDEAPPTVSKRKARDTTSEVDIRSHGGEIEDDPEVGNMQAWMSKKTWEPMVKEITTVERAEDGSLLIYFTLCVLNNGKMSRHVH